MKHFSKCKIDYYQ